MAINGTTTWSSWDKNNSSSGSGSSSSPGGTVYGNTTWSSWGPVNNGGGSSYSPAPAPAPSRPAAPSPTPSYGGGGGGGYSPAPSYNYNPNLNMNAANNIVYWKQMYDQAVNAGKKGNELDYFRKQASQYYNQLDQGTAQQLQGMNANQAAAWYRAQKEAQSQYKQPQNNPATGVNQPQYDPYADIMNNPIIQQLMAQMQGFGDQQAQYQQMLMQMQQEAAAQAEAFQRQQAEQLSNQYNSLIKQYDQAQDADLQALDRQFQEDAANMDDEAFQQYLQARQAMANRGLAGSGLANDQDTRLLMANSKNRTSLMNSLANQKNSVKLRYGGQIDQLKNQLASLPFPSVSGVGKTLVNSNPNSGYLDAINDALLNAYKPSEVPLKYAESMMNTLIPYMAMTQKDKADLGGFMPDGTPTLEYLDKMLTQNRELSKLRGYFDDGSLTLDAWDKQNTASRELSKLLGYLPDGTPTLDGWYKQTSAAQELAKMLGYLPDGTPTLDANKFALDKWYKEGLLNQGQQKIDVDKWYKDNKLSLDFANYKLAAYKTKNQVEQDWAKVRIEKQKANTSIARLKWDQTKFATQQEFNAYKSQVSSAESLMNASYKEMQAAQAALAKFDDSKKDTPEYQSLVKQYNEARNKYQVAYGVIDQLSQIGIDEGANVVNQKAKGFNGTTTSPAANDFLNFIPNLLGKNEVLKTFGSKATSGIVQTQASQEALAAAKQFGVSLTSGKRSPEKNKAVGGSKTSAHMSGRAYDFGGSKANMEKFAQWAKASGKFKQVIWNDVDLMSGRKIGGHKDHVHVSW